MDMRKRQVGSLNYGMTKYMPGIIRNNMITLNYLIILIKLSADIVMIFWWAAADFREIITKCWIQRFWKSGNSRSLCLIFFRVCISHMSGARYIRIFIQKEVRTMMGLCIWYKKRGRIWKRQVSEMYGSLSQNGT